MKIATLADAMREVQHNCELDAMRIDGMPLDGITVGKAFGSTLAMIATVARAVEMLAEDLL